MMLKKVTKKHILSLAVAAFAGVVMSATASAAVNGPYIGGQIGYGNIHQDFGLSNTKNTRNASSKDTGVAGRVFGGYQATQNFAAEMGYSKFSNATATQTGSIGGTKVTADGTIKAYAVDLVGKAILPLQNGFSIYGKAGIAYLSETADVTVTAKTGSTKQRLGKADKTEHHIYPTFGTGLAYDVTQNIVADVSWNHIQKTGKSDLANTDLYAVGLAYNFG